MRRVGQVRRRDSNEPDIRKALAAVGARSWQVSCPGGPDLVVAFRGNYYAAEVKTKLGKETPLQGAFPIWRSPDEALKAIGALHLVGAEGTR